MVNLNYIIFKYWINEMRFYKNNRGGVRHQNPLILPRTSTKKHWCDGGGEGVLFAWLIIVCFEYHEQYSKGLSWSRSETSKELIIHCSRDSFIDTSCWVYDIDTTAWTILDHPGMRSQWYQFLNILLSITLTRHRKDSGSSPLRGAAASTSYNHPQS